MAKDLRITIRPDFETARISLGYESYDEIQVMNIQRKQDCESKSIEIHENELFIIPEGFTGIIDSDETYNLFSDRYVKESNKNYPFEDELISGIYKFSAKDLAILRFADVDDNRENLNEADFYFELNSVSKVDIVYYKEIFNFIKNYAKTKFDYKSLVNDTDENTADFILYQLIRSLSTREPNKIIVDNLSAILSERNFNIEKRVLVKFVKKRSTDLILAALGYGYVIDEISKGTKKLTLLKLQKLFYE